MTDIPNDPDTLVQKIKSAPCPSNLLEAFKAKLSAVLAERFSSDLAELRKSLSSFKSDIGSRLDELNKELENTRREFCQSSAAAKWHSWALVIATVALVFATFLLFRAAQEETQSHIEPEMSLEVVNEDGGKVIISNDGVHPLSNVVVEVDTGVFWGPSNKMDSERMTTMRRVPGKSGGWWQIKQLKPGEVQNRSVQDVTNNAFRLRKELEEAKENGKLRGITPKSKVQARILLHFRMTVHREVDRKQFKMSRVVELMADSHTGQPILWDFEMTRQLEPGAGLEQYLKQLLRDQQS